MQLTKYTKLTLLLFALIFLITSYQFLWIYDPFLSRAYDLITQQKPVKTDKDLVKILSTTDKVKYSQTSENYKLRLTDPKATSCKGKKFLDRYKEKEFYIINWFERYKYLAGRKRAKDFLTPDRLFRSNIKIPFTSKYIPLKNKIKIPHQDKTQYLLIDTLLLKKLILLDKKLKSKNFTNSYAITSSFRNPKYNKMVHGKMCSRHQHGDAVDIHVYDINKDGKANKEDREALYKVLNEEVIKEDGGLGYYKSFPMLIHLDTRGYKARWHY